MGKFVPSRDLVSNWHKRSQISPLKHQICLSKLKNPAYPFVGVGQKSMKVKACIKFCTLRWWKQHSTNENFKAQLYCISISLTLTLFSELFSLFAYNWEIPWQWLQFLSILTPPYCAQIVVHNFKYEAFLGPLQTSLVLEVSLSCLTKLRTNMYLVYM